MRIADNKLLASMNEEDRAPILPLLEGVDLPSRFVLAHEHLPCEYIYFLTSGICSFGINAGSEVAEVALVGSEGVSLPWISTGQTRSPMRVTMQNNGQGYRFNADQLVASIGNRFTLLRVLSEFYQCFTVQISYWALANATQPIDRRVARWLLMVQDRSDNDDIIITHADLSKTLNTRRQSVTAAFHNLESRHLVVSTRRRIHIANRKGLEEFAGDAYQK